MSTHLRAGSRLRNCLVVIGAMCVGATVATQQPQFPTGGPIPDRRGFEGVNDRRYPTVMREGFVIRRVAGQVYVIAGAGPNVVVMAGNDGVLVVDTNYALFWDQIRTAIRQISDKPIRFLINTHVHPDHIESNDSLAKLGATVIAHPDTRAQLERPLPGGGTRPPGMLPTVTSSEPITFHFNGEEVTYVPLKTAHARGDAAVYFHGSDVFAFGDVFTNDYPSLATGQGGTIENFVDNYNLAALMGTPQTIFVPGHGQLADRGDLMYVRDAVTIIHDRFLAMVKDGKTLEHIRQARPSKEYDERLATEICCSPQDRQTSTRFYQQLYDEAVAHTNGKIGTVHQTATASPPAAGTAR